MNVIKWPGTAAAQIMMDGVAAKASERGLPVRLAVTDERGDLIDFRRGGRDDVTGAVAETRTTSAVARRSPRRRRRQAVEATSVGGDRGVNSEQ